MLSMQSNLDELLVSFPQGLGENKTAVPHLSSVLGQVDKFDMMLGDLSEKVKSNRENTAKIHLRSLGLDRTTGNKKTNLT